MLGGLWTHIVAILPALEARPVKQQAESPAAGYRSVDMAINTSRGWNDRSMADSKGEIEIAAESMNRCGSQVVDGRTKFGAHATFCRAGRQRLSRNTPCLPHVK